MSTTLRYRLCSVCYVAPYSIFPYGVLSPDKSREVKMHSLRTRCPYFHALVVLFTSRDTKFTHTSSESAGNFWFQVLPYLP